MTFDLTIASSKQKELIDISDKILRIVSDSKVQDGLLVIFARHTTCSLIISEVEDTLARDFIKYLTTEGPKGPFNHSHGDLKTHDPPHTGESHTPAHLLSAMIGQSVNIPITRKKLQLGTWQRICLLELDGPRQRNIIVQIFP